jgi:hypothetical protein
MISTTELWMIVSTALGLSSRGGALDRKLSAGVESPPFFRSEGAVERVAAGKVETR